MSEISEAGDAGASGSKSGEPMVRLSPGFSAWLETSDCSLALTTYQAGRLVFVGRRPGERVRVHERLIEQCQGLWTDGQTLWTSSLHTLWRFENTLSPQEAAASGVDRRFAPREGRVTGRLDIHDIGIGDVGEGIVGPIFVNTAFNCLATIDERHSFRPLWLPRFVSALVAEDRCHLNGLAMDGSRPAVVSAIGRSDLADGWRADRHDGGILIDVGSGEIVATGLSMPHSPRLYRGDLWVLDSGRGELCVIDPANGARTSVSFCPGYARGLCFIGKWAVVGLSRPRSGPTFGGLDLDSRLSSLNIGARAGLIVIDLDAGQIVEWLHFDHTIDEMYDVAVLPGVYQPEAIGFRGADIERADCPATGVVRSSVANHR